LIALKMRKKSLLIWQIAKNNCLLVDVKYFAQKPLFLGTLKSIVDF
jgi:hypothetical protein